ncbi:DUF4870 domain-containing protein [Aphanothece hegewaldii CCALA 016]|uniref:DUF4870 domain-containing protein n=1 Tax=Aphanothece hegewaldii CCALA 016 TaxID=2107694 RepID=A0A2T1LWT0_9CHRO|nr:DUF4870 domain-containing protein [Aphanothece hegewaldii CCALA 016]
MEDTLTRRKLLAAISHGSVLLTATLVSWAIPLVVYLISEDAIAKDHAKEALNFHINIAFWGFIFGILTGVLIGWAFLAALGLITIIFPIIALLSVFNDPDKVYRYPLIYRLL